jgi:Cwf15/Cwc15 cell cycle control protein
MVNLDADDPVDDSDSDSGDSDDDTAMLMAELQKIKAEKAKEEAEKVIFNLLYTGTGIIFKVLPSVLRIRDPVFF